MTDQELIDAVDLARGRVEFVSLEVAAVDRLIEQRRVLMRALADEQQCECGGPVWESRAICIDCGESV